MITIQIGIAEIAHRRIMVRKGYRPRVIVDGLPLLFDHQWHSRLDLPKTEDWISKPQTDDSLFTIILRMISLITYQFKVEREIIYGSLDTLVKIAEIAKDLGSIKRTEYDIISMLAKLGDTSWECQLIYILEDTYLETSLCPKRDLDRFQIITKLIKDDNGWTKVITVKGEADKIWSYIDSHSSVEAVNKALNMGETHEDVLLKSEQQDLLERVPVYTRLYPGGIKPRDHHEHSKRRIDLFAPYAVTLKPQARVLMDLKVYLEVPSTHMLIVTNIPNQHSRYHITAQVISGRVKVLMENFSDALVRVQREERVASAIVMQASQPELVNKAFDSLL